MSLFNPKEEYSISVLGYSINLGSWAIAPLTALIYTIIMFTFISVGLFVATVLIANALDIKLFFAFTLIIFTTYFIG